MSDNIVCTIRFESDEVFSYHDTLPKETDKERVLTGSIDRTCLSWRTAQVLGNWVRDCSDRIHRQELELLGLHLYQLIFSGKVGSRFRATYDTCMQLHAHRFRVELHFGPKAREVADLPWEFLYVPESVGGKFLAGQRDEFVLTRLAIAGDDSATDKGNGSDEGNMERPLRVLVASCSPDMASDVEEITASVWDLNKSYPIEVTRLVDPTFDELQKNVNRRSGPHVLHLVGHGKPGGMLLRMERSEAADVLAEASRLAGTGPENDNASANGSRDARRVFVDVRTVTSLFEAYQPHLVFLHSCDGDVPSLTSVYSTARAIVYSSVPAVVAMQYQISAGDAIRFVKEFYHQLAAGCSVGEAVAAGRRNLAKGGEDTGIRQDWSTRLFGTPVVYLRRDSPLVSEPVEAPRSNSQAPGPPPPTGQLTCPGCGSPLSATAPACPECGLQLQCASCGARYEQPGITKFCSMCGTPVPKTPGPVRSEVITVSGRWKRDVIA